MKFKLNLLLGALLASGFSYSVQAAAPVKQPGDTSPTPLGAEKPNNATYNVRIKNMQDEDLGRIKDLAVDLVNGRIVEVLIVSDSSLDVKNKIVAVPPLALVADGLNDVYRLNVSTETFKSAPAVDLSKWADAAQSTQVAAAYRLFGQEPYFLEEGATANPKASRPLVKLGYVERTIKLLDMPVGNLQKEKFGKVWSMNFTITTGRIVSVVVIAPGNFKTKSVIPATALTFDDERKTLLLDDTKLEYADEPRFVFTEAAFGQAAYSREEAYTGPHTSVALEQGNTYRDLDRTVEINREIRLSKINGRNVQVGTLNGRVTLRGWVYTAEDKAGIGQIAINASRLELVDNQIVVGKPVSNN